MTSLKCSTDLFGGSLVSASDLHKRITKVCRGKKGLEDVALLLKVPGFHTSFKKALLLEGDVTIGGDWLVDPEQKWIKSNQISLIACFGNLKIERDIINDSDKYWPVLFVEGDLELCNFVKGGVPLIVGGNLNASGYVIGEYNDGPIRLAGDLHARAYVPQCKDRKEAKGHVIAGRVHGHMFDAREDFSSQQLHADFVSDVLVYRWFSVPKLLQYGHENRNALRSNEDRKRLLEKKKPEPVELPPLSLDKVDPVSKGKLVSASDALERLCARVMEVIVHDPDSNSYPQSFAEYVRYQLESSCDQVLFLPSGCKLVGDLKLDWDETWIEENNIAAIATQGDLEIDGDVVNRMLEGGPMLFVDGKLTVRNVFKGGATVIVLGDVLAGGIVVGEYNDGVLRIGGNLQAQSLMLFDHDGFVRGFTACPTYTDDDGEWRDVLEDYLFDSEDDYHPNVDKLIACQRGGMRLLRGED